jgi:hypothetical protein
MSGYYSPILCSESVSAVTATPSVDIGTRRFDSGREYVYIYNGGGEVAPGYVMIATGVSGYTCVATYAFGTSKPLAMGVVRNATLTTGTYGWICTRGFTDLYNIGTASVAVSNRLALGADGAVFVDTDTSAITALVHRGNFDGYAMQATDTAGTFGAYVRMG